MQEHGKLSFQGSRKKIYCVCLFKRQPYAFFLIKVMLCREKLLIS